MVRSLLVPLPLLAACALGAPKSAEDCLPTLGDHCDCEPKCMTQAEIDRVQSDGVCDLGCFETGAAGESWECVLVDGACAVKE